MMRVAMEPMEEVPLKELRQNQGRPEGDAENARHEIAGHENAAPDCKGGKCET